MIADCPNCQTKFNVDEGRVSDAGSKVRCSVCKHIFTIHKPAAQEPQGPPAAQEDDFGLEGMDLDAGDDFDLSALDEDGEAGLSDDLDLGGEDEGPRLSDIEEDGFEFEALGQGVDSAEADLSSEPEEDELGVSHEFGELDEDDEAGFFGSGDDDETVILPQSPAAQAPRPRGRFLTLLLLLLLFVLAGAAVFYYQPSLVLGLFDKQARVAAKDPSGARMIALDQNQVKHQLVINGLAGELHVITGQVKNAYDQPRSFIQLKVDITDKTGKILASSTVYAGNVVDIEGLARLPMTVIKPALSQRAGMNNANVNIPPGRLVEFMAVLDRVPNTAASYNVTVLGSQPADRPGN